MINIFSLKKQNIGAILALTALFFFTVTILSFNIHKPLNLDETDFAIGAHGLMNDPAFFSKTPELGLWHPPMYMYMLSGAFKVLGETTEVARGLGFIFYVSTFIFIMLICKELFEPKDRRIVSLIAGGLYLINPVLTQFSLLIDVDGGLLTLLMAIFCYFFIRFSKDEMGPKRLVILGIIFGTAMLAKFTTPPLIMPVIFLFYALSREYKRAFLNSFLIFFVGMIFFWTIWYLYCKIFDVQLLFPFKYTFSTKWGQGGLALTQQKIASIAISLKFLFYWVTPGFAIAMLFVTVDRIRAIIKNKATERIDFLMILGVLVFLFYFYYFPRAAMMKYQCVFYPYFIIIIAGFLYKAVIKNSEINKREIIIISVFAVGAFAYYFTLFPDMVLWLMYGKEAISGPLKSHYGSVLTLYLVPFLVLPLIFLFFLKKRSFYYSVVVTFFLLTFVIQITQNIKQTADYTTANSWNNYGERGQAEAIDYLNKRLPAKGYSILRKDIAYYVRRRRGGSPTREYIYNSIFRQPKREGLEELRRIVSERSIEYVQVDTALPLRYCFDLLKADFDLDKQFYNFFIFKKK